MSMPSDQATPKKSSAAGRYFFLFLVGLIAGAIGVVMLMRTWEARKTWNDKWHDAVMDMNEAHFQRLKANIDESRCAATDTLPSLQTLRILANDLEPAFPGIADEPRFKQHASKYRSILNAAVSAPPQDCAGADRVKQDILAECKACHQDYRG